MFEKMKIVMSGIWGFVVPFLRVMMSQAGPILASAAMAAVQAAVGSTGEEKRKAAYDAIVKDLRNQGIRVGKDIGESMVNAALELAVVKMKSL